jgi:CubicO group peptidase (beta-lactamase class C family)
MIVSAMLAGFFVSQGVAADEKAASALPAERVEALDTAIETLRQRFRVPGLAVGIVDGGVPVYVRGFGVRDAQSSEPVTPHTLFHVASISKTFTATAVMQLVEQGRMKLDDPIGRYLPEFSNSPITLTHLLTHSAGLADWYRASGATDERAVAEFVSKVAQHDLAYAPGQGWDYSDTAFNILGIAVEAVSAETYPQYMQRHVLVPARMTESSFEQPADSAAIAWPHLGEILVRRAPKYPWDRVFLPSAGLAASVTDLMQWASVNLSRDPALLSPTSYETMFQHRLDSAWEGMGMGLGWQLERRDERWLPRHAGGEYGFSALLTLFPEQQRAIVILSNGETTPRMAIRDVVEAVLDGKPVELRDPPILQRRSTHWIALVISFALMAAVVALLRSRRRSA